MKSRELMTCETKVFAARIQALKSKEVERHVAWAASHLGVQDHEALTRAVLEAMFNDGDLPQDSGEEMRRVRNAVSPFVTDPQGQSKALLRLVALYVTYVRKEVNDEIRAQRRREKQAPGPTAPDAGAGHGHDHCDDPDCRDHGHDRGPLAAQTALARGIRASIA